MFNISEQFVNDTVIAEGGMEEIQAAGNLILDYLRKDHYKSKRARIVAWLESKPQVYELIISIFTATLTNESLTYQAIVGKLNHKIKLKETVDRVKIIADIVGLISQTGLIDIDRPGNGQHIQISTDYDLGVEIPEPAKHELTIHRPQPVEQNWDEELGSMLLGHSMNHHEFDICLSHLDRMNQIPLKLNEAFVNHYKETPKNEPDTQKAMDQWDQFMHESFGKYQELIEENKTFYLIHKYDTRGRTYACGYHVTTQGNGYKKAIIELANEEMVNG